MFKDYFSVAIHHEKLVLHGVTSIMPNLNGFLFQTINGKSYQMNDNSSDNNISLEYFDSACEIPEDYRVIDGIN